jgi:hypothetical protein
MVFVVFSCFSIEDISFPYFQQVNNNFLSAGNANKELTVTSLLLVAKYISVLLFSFVF